eukprot:CAMPEP_0197469054 /NCGR_PEP_ID=MMETSP1175-20131217/66406_1 /TAXON_ID=1003142 /ORGANISM="Triceratium dubium, Strain CCMP147" /LENGTH=331 /DNA_ID=CAMNT_0043005187 /DNA_START=178 /DNA_END=1173 /DNA_ORIENTATION=-
MPATRSTRNVRRKAATRNVLGALDENETSTAPASTTAAVAKATKPISTAIEDDVGSLSSLQLPSDLDGSDAPTIRLLQEDISHEVKKRQDSIAFLADQATSAQQQVASVHKMKIQKSVRSMTVRDFDAKFGCDILAEVRKAMASGGEGVGVPFAATVGEKRDRPGFAKAPLSKGDGGEGVGVPFAATVGEKRDRPGFAKAPLSKGDTAGAMDLVTPAPKGGDIVSHAPGTSLRTVRRGEAIFSANGSPVDKTEEGDLVATVCKKQKGNLGGDGKFNNGAAVFDINVGDGRYVNLSNPGTIQHLDQDMKTTAMSQLKILQDQMAGLMAQLGD